MISFLVLVYAFELGAKNRSLCISVLGSGVLRFGFGYARSVHLTEVHLVKKSDHTSRRLLAADCAGRSNGLCAEL